jgi:hypothetical protein
MSSRRCVNCVHVTSFVTITMHVVPLCHTICQNLDYYRKGVHGLQ